MFYTHFALTFHNKMWIPSVDDLRKSCIFVFSCLCDAMFSFVVLEGGAVLIHHEVPVAIMYGLTGIAYVATLGRRALISGHRVFSLAMLPVFIPLPMWFLSHMPCVRINVTPIVVSFLWIIGSRWPLYFPSSQRKSSSWSILQKGLVFVALQSAYGVTLQRFYPAFHETLMWPGSMYHLRPDYRYPTKSGLQFFYKNRNEADKIEARLPEVVAILKDSPFYQTLEELVLVQKKHRIPNAPPRSVYARQQGVFSTAKARSYFFTGAEGMPIDPVYYARNDLYRSLVLHELTHQLVARYYGKWSNILFYSTRWKQEGYAEYMIATQSYSTKAELAAILRERELSDFLLEHPFATESKRHDVTHYMAAFLQTRYALDEKNISPFEFFERSYTLAPASVIREWLAL